MELIRTARKKESGRALLFCGLGLALVVAGCSKQAEVTPDPVVTVQAAHPEQGPIAEHITADAVLAPLAQAAISPKITAPVAKFYVQRGSKVKAGELLATLENRDLRAQALDSEGSYTAAQAAYETETKAQAPEDYQKAQLDLAQAKANLTLSQSVANSRKQLFAEGAVPGRDLDTANAALVQAQAAYDVAKSHLDSVESVSRKATLRAAEGQLLSARGKYLGAQAVVNYSEVRSPIAGVVTDRALFAGETAAPGTAIVMVMDTSALVAKVHLAQPVAQRLSVGDAARITVPGMADPIKAAVSLISPALDPGSTTVEVWLRMDNKGGLLKVGTPVHVSVTGRRLENVLRVPASAVQTAADGTKSVMVIGLDGVAHSKPVTLGLEDAAEVQVSTGVAASDMVITAGGYGLADGAKVKVGAAADTAGGDDK